MGHDRLRAMSSISVRPAVESDYGSITCIQQRVPEAAQWPLGDYSMYAALIAFFNETPAGFCAWRQVSNDEAELLNLAVEPALRRQGIAAALIRALFERARGTIFLEVAEPNHAARSLYQKLGFTPIYVRKGYYGQGSINAVVMKKGS